MIEYRINLLRGRVPDAGRRRRRYWGMVGYVALAGIILVATLALSARRWMESKEYHRQVALLESEFRSSHNGFDGIRDFVRFQQQQLEKHSRSLQALGDFYATDLRVAQLLEALIVKLPPGAMLNRFAIEPENKNIQFEVLFVGPRTPRSETPVELQSQWNSDETISSQLGAVAFQGSSVDDVATRKDMLMRFTAPFKKGGG
ncbi:MAG: hypothetical protein M5U15_07510 [Kiritimatiellae bacterium]|nr:hypothetical protein [Kiritimatiellia bacterium]